MKHPAGISESEQSYANERISDCKFFMRSKLTWRATVACIHGKCSPGQLFESVDRDAR